MENQVSSRHKKIFRYEILERSCLLQYSIYLENARKRLLWPFLEQLLSKLTRPY